MYTSIVLTVLAGLVSPSTDVTWSTDYTTARQTGQNDKKPLAVFLGSGEHGHDKVCRDGTLSKEAQEALQKNYVCVYVDMSSPAGKRLADAFEITQPAGMVLSDRTGDTQAFSHNGAISGSDLTRALTRFADPSLVVQTTVTDLNATRMSFYPPSENGTTSPYQPRSSYYPPMQSSYGYPAQFGGGCAGGNCGGGGRIGRR
jgi:hypothetical protein